MGLLSAKLRAAIGTDHWKIPVESTILPLPVPPETPAATELGDIHKNAQVINDLNDVRNRYALRITKGTAGSILAHKNKNELVAWLEVKPLFQSGVILHAAGKFPFLKLAQFLQLSERQTRRYVATWRKLKLARWRNKDLCLASYDRLNVILKTECRRRHKLLNNGDTKTLVRQIAIHENLSRQTYQRNNKLVELERSGKLFDAVDTSTGTRAGNNIRRCENRLSQRAGRRLKKAVLRGIDELLPKWKRIYDAQMNQLEFGKPAFNPYVTLSCAGVARICGLSSASAGHRISLQLERKGWLKRSVDFLKIDKGAAVYEAQFMRIRSDVFGYKYPVKRSVRGLETKFFRRLPQMIETSISPMIF